jgi:uncharacterized C2H2 Zn-finger protein
LIKQLTHKCPDCPRMFASRTGLGSHRRSAHGIEGQSKSTLAARAAKPAREKPAKPLSEYKRLKLHLQEMKAPENPAPNQCPLCGYQTKSKGGLSLHINTSHAQAKAGERKAERSGKKQRREIERTQTQVIVASSNGHEENWQGHTDGIPEALIAVTSGRFQELCRSVAYEHDLPPRLFAARVAAFVYGTTLR